ncbi:MAG: SRPBCC family protein [Gammaproteobacteria bacterium]|nr:SRPBCC family protein [Gammaproteobacteria bacterium]MDH3905895.1 SRPBCC family protein [Gammaproteobacteria bacterium]MDH4004869.1 SRPBCC family protein [Gammaproteobacteria bacterium]NCF59597.1 ATPase [Gammaproteobacteria bacterium]
MSKPEFVYMTVIAALPERVWQGLTTAEFTQQYWHGTRVRSDFTPGATIEFLNDDDSVGVAGEILTADHPKELSYTWKFLRNPDAAADPASRVTFRLEPVRAGTRLSVIHDRLEEGSATATMVAFGWPHVVAGLKTLLETGEAVDFTAPEEPGCPGQQAAAGA